MICGRSVHTCCENSSAEGPNRDNTSPGPSTLETNDLAVPQASVRAPLELHESYNALPHSLRNNISANMSQKSGHGPAVPKGDVSYVRATAGNQPQLPIAPSPVMQPLPPENDWDDMKEIRLRELEEARARAAQMEKTMRWWSDCTANWREKWSKVRNERNKAREENRQLRAKLDSCIKENNTLKREREELLQSNQQKKQQLKSGEVNDVTQSPSDNGAPEAQQAVEAQVQASELSMVSTTSFQPVIPQSSSEPTVTKPEPCAANSQQELVPPVSKEELSPFDEQSEGSLAEERLALLELKLDESQKTISAERDEKIKLSKVLETVQQELNAFKSKMEEAKRSKHDVSLEIERLKELHKEELDRMKTDLEDESSSRSSMDRRLIDLRRELEKLQRENADEWGKRERLETEKQSLERENKKIRGQIQDLEEQLEKKTSHASSVVNSDMKSLQSELSQKNKELAELKHTHTKVKKTLQDRQTELDHCKRRAEQYEVEVKKLRSRVEELKRDLGNAEDEVDNQGNSVRRLQRTNDELQEQMETLQVQLEHLQSRLRTTASTSQFTTSKVNDLDDSDDDFSEGM